MKKNKKTKSLAYYKLFGTEKQKKIIRKKEKEIDKDLVELLFKNKEWLNVWWRIKWAYESNVESRINWFWKSEKIPSRMARLRKKRKKKPKRRNKKEEKELLELDFDYLLLSLHHAKTKKEKQKIEKELKQIHKKLGNP